MSGAGNDFVVVDNRNNVIADPPEFSRFVCNRRFGIGADGVLLLESHDSSAFTMKYYNADGSNAGMCGNGGRCLSKFAYDLGITGGESFTFEGFGHTYSVQRVDETTYELAMKIPSGPVFNQQISLQELLIKGNYINTGTDHAVIFLDDNPDLGTLASADVVTLGRSLRHHAVYQPAGANINFVSKAGSNSIEIRTYERGVEDETLACGTGSVASALLSALKYRMERPVEVIVKSGETLTISFKRQEDRFSEVKLKGSAVTTFTGIIDY
jgi:diaminopimelate epimerase